MHIITKKIGGKPYLYLAWNERLEGRRVKRYKYLAKSPRAALRRLESLDIPDAEKVKLVASLDSDTWQTPGFVIEAAIAVMGGIDLDPATLPTNPVGATQFYTKADDGLAQPWRGRVWLNPPYSKPAPFLLKLIKAYQAGEVTQAIALCKSGVLQNKGTGRAIAGSASGRCLWYGRLNFEHSKTKDKGRGADFDVVAIYWGDQPGRFAEVFDAHGVIS
jgi:phage N-6-adenine-methyltransferase